MIIAYTSAAPTQLEKLEEVKAGWIPYAKACDLNGEARWRLCLSEVEGDMLESLHRRQPTRMEGASCWGGLIMSSIQESGSEALSDSEEDDDDEAQSSMTSPDVSPMACYRTDESIPPLLRPA